MEDNQTHSSGPLIAAFVTLMFICLVVSCTLGSGAPKPTPNPLERTETALAFQATIDARATQGAAATGTQAMINAANHTATAEAQADAQAAFNLAIIQAEGTQQAAAETAHAFHQFQTSTANAIAALETAHAQLTAGASATAEARAATETYAFHAAQTGTQDAKDAAATSFAGTAIAATASKQAEYEQGTATAAAEDGVEQTQVAGELRVQTAANHAEAERIDETREMERSTMLWRTWAWRVALALLGLFTVYMVWRSRMVILTKLGLVRWGPAGKPYFVFATDDGGVALVDMSRSNSPVIKVEPAGDTSAPLPQDDPVIARAQAGELLLAANTGERDEHTRRQVLRRAVNAGNNTEYRVLPPSGPLAQRLLAPETREMLDAEWKDTDGN